MPKTYAINTSGVTLSEGFVPTSGGETELQCVARDVASLLESLFRRVRRDTVLDRIFPALFKRAH
jgi:hypothetical protein